MAQSILSEMPTELAAVQRPIAPQLPEVSVQVVMQRIRDGIRGVDKDHEWAREGRRAVPSHLFSGVSRLRSSTALLRNAIARIGDPPPTPPTLRGRLGLVLITAIRRCLFWLTPSIQLSQNQIVDALEGQLAATEEILRILQQTNTELARISAQAGKRE